MAHPIGIEFLGALYHVTSRGNAGQRVFRDDKDRETFLATMAWMVLRFRSRGHAYCLMDNHIHLLIDTPQPNLSRGMRQLNGVYTQRFNRRHRQVGHLFLGRFQVILVEQEGYLLELPAISSSTRCGRRWSRRRTATPGAATVRCWD